MDSPIKSGIEFAVIPGHPGYVAGDDGSIWSCWKPTGPPKRSQVLSGTWKQLRGDPRKEDGRLRYTIKRSAGGYRRCYGSHLVLEAFVGSRPIGYEACHNNGNCLDDSIKNLRWDTPEANKVDMQRHGSQVKGETHPKAKLSDLDVQEIIICRATGESLASLASTFGVTKARVCSIIKKGGR